MRSVDWKFEQAEREIAPVIAAASALDPKFHEAFPRNVEELLAVPLPALALRRETNLTVSLVVSILDRDFNIDQRGLLQAGDGQLGGFVYADDNRVVIFAETRFGVGFERFTIAHEGGHLIKEYLPRRVDRRQTSLFDAPADKAFLAHRDPHAHFLADGRSTGQAEGLRTQLLALKAVEEAYLREVIANSIGAELLAPFRLVRRLAGEVERPSDRVVAVAEQFGISRKAAAVRLGELGLGGGEDGSLSLFA